MLCHVAHGLLSHFLHILLAGWPLLMTPLSTLVSPGTHRISSQNDSFYVFYGLKKGKLLKTFVGFLSSINYHVSNKLIKINSLYQIPHTFRDCAQTEFSLSVSLCLCLSLSLCCLRDEDE